MTVPPVILSTPGEITPEERSAYYGLVRANYTGRGEIVEIGALLGASSVCLAQGLADNTLVDDKFRRIHVYDKFEVYPHLRDMVLPFAGLAPREVGASFLDLYLTNIAAYGQMLNVHQGDAHTAEWCGKPIEILFIDCALSARLYQHFINVFYPHLIEGALIIDQDFFYQFAPWLPVKAELMADQLKPLAAVDCAVIARCIVAAPTLAPSEAAIDQIPIGNALELMERQAIRWPGELAALIHIQGVVAMFNAGCHEESLRRLEQIRDWPLTAAARARFESAVERVCR